MIKKICLFAISDSTGVTVKNLCTATLEGMGLKYSLTLIQIKHDNLKECINTISTNPNPVFISIASPVLEQKIINQLSGLKIPLIPILKEPREAILNYYNIPIETIKFKPSAQHNTQANLYKARIDAIEYSISVDDGTNTDKLNEAHIIIIGPSRCSKTPVSIYTANQGYKTANIPIITNLPIVQLNKIHKNKCVVGFILDHNELFSIRSIRLKKLEFNQYSSYIDMSTIKHEILTVKNICNQNNWPVIDVTRRSIEEISAHIIEIYNRSKIK